MLCPKCKHEIADNSMFCPFCGQITELSELKEDYLKICPNCNKTLNADLEVCPNCLYNFSDASFESGSQLFIKTSMKLVVFIFLFLLVAITIYCFNESNEFAEDFIILVVLILFFTISILFCGKIKNLVLKVSRWLLDFGTTLDVLSGIIILLAGIPISMNSYGNVPYWWFIAGAFVYSLVMLVKDYVLYLLVDIRDSLKILSDKAKLEMNESDKN